jgi:transcriptional regulator NrdR family protein
MSDARVNDAAVRDGCGLHCGKCGQGQFRVIYTRRAPGAKIVRRRQCRGCGTRITTYEHRASACSIA